VKIGINMNAFGEIDIDKQIALMLENGFETTFVRVEHPKFEAMMHAAQQAGILCECGHAPFDKINDIWYAGEEGEQMLERLCRSADACARYDIPVLMMHLSSGRPAPRISEIGYQRLDRLVKHTENCGVKLAFENQRYLGNIAFAFEQFPTVGFCWDVGHEDVFAGGRRYMPLFGDRLCQLHVHDNFFEKDVHIIPYDGKVDFERVAASIAAVDYDRSLMLELNAPVSDVYRDWTPERYYQHAAQGARKVADRVEYYRSARD
jgi:sugar phosphate isomerase/epimerase